MADNKETVILGVEFDAEAAAAKLAEVSKGIADLKKQSADLRKEMKENGDESGELATKLAGVTDELKKEQKEQAALIKTTQLLTDTGNTYGDSLNEMRRKLGDLQKAYDNLSQAERESAKGKEMLKSLQEQDKAVKSLEESTGRFQRNVGNYKDALGGLAGTIDGVKKKMQALWANPWAAIIAAIVLVIKKLIEAFKRSEDRMNELRAALAPLKGAGDLLMQVFDKLAAVVGKVLVGALEGALKAVKWVAKALDKIGMKLGKNWGLSETFQAAAENSSKLTQAEQEYIKHRRAWVEEEAKIDNKIAKLRDKAAQKDKYTAEQRIAFIEQAIALERKKADEQVKLAQEELKIAEMDAARAENDQEANDKLAEARAKVTRANTEYLENTRRLQAQLVTFRAEVLKTAEAEQEAAEKTAEVDDKAQAEREKAHAKLQEKIRQWTMSDIERLEDEMKRDLETADITAEEKLAIEQHYAEQIKEIRDQMASEEAERQQQEVQMKADSAEQWLGTIQNVYTEIGNAVNASQQRELQEYQDANNAKKKDLEKRLKSGLISQAEYDAAVEQADRELAMKEYEIELKQAKQEKAMGIITAGINTALAIMRIWADVPKVDFGASTIAMTAAAAAIGAAQIAAIAAQPLPSPPQFAEGGFVPGTSYSGDRVGIRTNSGEAVLNPAQQRNFMELANGGGVGFDYGALADVVIAGVAAQPAPVMDYAEFTEFQQKTATYNEIAAI